VEAHYLLELKLTALAELTVQDYLKFLGFEGALPKQREAWFEQLKAKMTLSCRQFWAEHIAKVRQGVCYTGHFEQFLARVRPLVKLLFGNSIHAFFQNKYQKKDFPYSRWRLLRWLFSQKWIYWLMGNRDEAFVGRGCHTSIIPNGLQILLKENRFNESFMSHLIFKGHLKDMQPSRLPPSLQPEVLRNIQNALRKKTFRVEYYCEDLLTFLDKDPIPLEDCVFCSSSDVMSFERPEYLLACLNWFKDRPGKSVWVARFFLRNQLTPPIVDEILSMGFSVTDISEMDKSAMYQVYKIEN
jgi:S-adenosylmethionine:diacylglycerol 3-amino-3-carboxypropyl transferase